MRTAYPFRERLRDVRDAMMPFVDRGEIPGLVYAIGRDDDSHIEAIGSQSLGGPLATPDSIFRISSMTKPVVAVAAMTLVEDGVLRLDEPVDRLLPEMASRSVLTRIDAPLDETVPAARPISIYDVLTSRLGLGIVPALPGTYPIQAAMAELELGQGSPNPLSVPPPDEWMRRLGALPLIHQPGERWMYGTSLDVLGILVARAAGTDLGSFLRERIFEPLAMIDTGFSVPSADIDRLATGYGVDDTSGSLRIFDPPAGGQWSRPPAFQSGAAGLVSTAGDYLSFARMLLNGGQHEDVSVLNALSVAEMTRDHLTPEQRTTTHPFLEPGEGWGFGVAVANEANRFGMSRGSYGWNGGLGSVWLSVPDARATMILLTQVAWNSPGYPAVCEAFLTAGFVAVTS